MKTKRSRVAILVLALVAAMLVLGRLGYDAFLGKEDLDGPCTAIPDPAVTTQPAPPSAGPADWPRWRGPNGDGKSAQTGIRKDWAGGLTRLWQVNFLCQDSRTVTWSAPAVRGNRLVVPGRASGRDLVFCLNPATGAVLWQQSYEAKAGMSHGSGPRATPCIDGDRVYTFGRGGHLASWQLADGKQVWLRNVEELGGKAPTWGHSSSPLIHGDKVIVQGGGKALVAAYEKMTGEPAWQAMEGKAGYAAPIVTQTPAGPRLLVFHGTGLACLDPVDGRRFWSIPWKTAYDANAATPLVSGATVFITSGYGVGCQALTLEDAGPTVLWQNKAIASHHSDPVLVDGHLYGYSGQSTQNKGHFKCVALADGAEKWSTDLLGWGTVLYVDGHLLCMDIDGNLFLVKPDPGECRVVTQFRAALGPIKHPAWTIPVVANGRLFLRYIQRMVCYEL